MVGWTAKTSDEVERTLEGIASDSPCGRRPAARRAGDRRALARLQLRCVGLADAGEDGGPGRVLRGARRRSPAPEPAPEVPGLRLVGAAARGSLETRRRAAAAHPDSARLALAYAVSLQEVGRRADARAAAEQSVAADPRSIDAQVAAIVLGYDKDSPATAVGALGGLIKSNPQAVSPVFHLALLLLWIKRNALAEQEFAKAVKLDPSGRIGRVALAFLTPLRKSSG